MSRKREDDRKTAPGLELKEGQGPVSDSAF
jgi:hypothetical protein